MWLGVPTDFDREACLELADGLAELAVEQGVAVLGGDVTAASALSVSVTAVGHAGRRGGPGRPRGRGAGHGPLRHRRARRRGRRADAARARGPARRSCRTEAREAAVTRQLDPDPAARGRRRPGGCRSAGDDRRLRRPRRPTPSTSRPPPGSASRSSSAASRWAPAYARWRRPRAVTRSSSPPRAARTTSCSARSPAPRSAGAASAVAEHGTTLTEIGRVVSGSSVRLRLPGGRSVPASGHDHLRVSFDRPAIDLSGSDPSPAWPVRLRGRRLGTRRAPRPFAGGRAVHCRHASLNLARWEWLLVGVISEVQSSSPPGGPL